MNERNNVTVSQLQNDFCQSIRNPTYQPNLDAFTVSRLEIYKELVFSNIQSIVEQCFPITQEIVSQEEWLKMVRFFVLHLASNSPYFHHLPKLMIDTLTKHNYAWSAPYIRELMHYEWLELYVDLLDLQEDKVVIVDSQSHLTTPLTLSKLAVIASYEYPVDRLGMDNIQVEKESFWVAVYRDEEFDINFTRLNEITFYMLSKFKHDTPTALEVISDTISRSPNHSEAIISEAPIVIHEWVNQGLLVGKT